MNKLVSGAIGFEVALLQDVNRVFLPDLAILKNKRIKHIDCCAITKTANNNDVIGSGFFRSILLTLKEMNTQTELIRAFPCSLLSPSNRFFINKIADMPHSFVDVSGISNADRLNKFLYFVFWFDEPEVWGQIAKSDFRAQVQPLEIKLNNYKTYFSENMELYEKRYQNLMLSFPYLTPKGELGITENISKSKFLTLKRGNLEFIHRVPLILFYQEYDLYPMRLQNIKFDIQSSYIESLTVTTDDLKSVFFNAVIDDSKNT